MPTIAETVRVRGNDDVILSITIGDGQIGGASILLDSRELVPVLADGMHFRYLLGRGDALRFSILVGTVKVKDVNAASDNTTVTATVIQGQSQRIFRDHAKAPTNGIVNYGLSISFI